MLRAIASYTTEANVVDTWISFLDRTWVFQTVHTKKNEEEVKYVIYFNTSVCVSVSGVK